MTRIQEIIQEHEQRAAARTKTVMAEYDRRLKVVTVGWVAGMVALALLWWLTP